MSVIFLGKSEQFKNSKKHTRIIQMKHQIDCNADPFIPEGWRVKEHIKGGQLELSWEDIGLYLSTTQEKGDDIDGCRLEEELEGKIILNANVLDYFLKNPQYIPDECKNKEIGFWGTHYMFSAGCEFVRCLSFGLVSYFWSCPSFYGRFFPKHHVAVLAKNNNKNGRVLAL